MEGRSSGHLVWKERVTGVTNLTLVSWLTGWLRDRNWLAFGSPALKWTTSFTTL